MSSILIHRREWTVRSASPAAPVQDEQTRQLLEIYRQADHCQQFYLQACRMFGPESAEARLEAHKLENAYQSLYFQAQRQRNLREPLDAAS